MATRNWPPPTSRMEASSRNSTHTAPTSCSLTSCLDPALGFAYESPRHSGRGQRNDQDKVVGLPVNIASLYISNSTSEISSSMFSTISIVSIETTTQSDGGSIPSIFANTPFSKANALE